MKKRSNPPPPDVSSKPPPPPAPPKILGKRITGVIIDEIEADSLAFKVQSRLCATCIYRPDSPLDIRKLEADVADPKMEGYFAKYRECHHAKRGSKVCCRGFWNAHKDDFTAGQLAQRLGIVRFVDVDVMPESSKMAKQNRRMRRAQAKRNRRAE